MTPIGYRIPITQHPAPTPQDARFSIIIPTWNNLAYLQLCVRSLQQHSTYRHQIILHINDGSDGTLDWARQQGLAYSHSPQNVGICLAVNAAAGLATTDYIAYFNDDMYALPGWDEALWQVLEQLGHTDCFLSSTMVEPEATGNACVLAPHNYGRTTDTFREAELLAAHPGWHMPDWTGATWPPNVVSRRLWQLVGGYSTELSPGMYSDPDFSAKLWQLGVRHFQGVGASRVYHFMSKSTLKVRKNDGKRQFLAKWGLTSGDFGRLYLRRGQPWAGPCPEPDPAKVKKALTKGKAKRLLGL